MSYSEQIYAEIYKNDKAGDFPMALGVEVTNHCNLRCPMCPREIAGRGVGLMDEKLFRDIVDQVSGRDRVLFLPQGFGESFMHPEFPSMINYMHEQKLGLSMLVTNATYLTDENIQELINSQIQFINISLDGTNKQVFESIRVNANYEDVVAKVERLFELRDQRVSVHPHIILRMILMPETQGDAEAFRERWSPFLREHDEIQFSSYQTWSNTVEDKRLDKDSALNEYRRQGKTPPPCRMMFNNLQVYYDGRATPCCYDYDCTMDVGNVKEQSIEEVWQGEKMLHYRQIHEEGRLDEIAICKNCPEYIP